MKTIEAILTLTGIAATVSVTVLVMIYQQKKVKDRQFIEDCRDLMEKLDKFQALRQHHDYNSEYSYMLKSDMIAFLNSLESICRDYSFMRIKKSEVCFSLEFVRSNNVLRLFRRYGRWENIRKMIIKSKNQRRN